jgi:hypothetical protein
MIPKQNLDGALTENRLRVLVQDPLHFHHLPEQLGGASLKLPD